MAQSKPVDLIHSSIEFVLDQKHKDFWDWNLTFTGEFNSVSNKIHRVTQYTRTSIQI